MGTSWILLCKRQLRYLGKNDLECKYFHISNCILTMKGCTVKKIILRCFFATGLFYLHEKFQLSQSSPSCILSKNDIFLSYLWGKYFSCKMFTVLHQSKKELSDSGQNWAKTWHLLFKTWKSSISMDSAIVHSRTPKTCFTCQFSQ